VVNGAIHRIIEQQAAMQPEVVALVDGSDTVTYRDLNWRANALARRLAECGLKRGGHALVRMDRGVELATVLLAILKAGAAYSWIEPGSAGDLDLPASFCIEGRKSASEQSYLAVDIRSALAACEGRPSPNLPVLTRGSDIACVLSDSCGASQVLVPHETITAMPATARGAGWASETGAFDLWIGLMSGETLTIHRAPAAPGQGSGVPAATQAA
jgi:non-ribosomal peptide synthetase component F